MRIDFHSHSLYSKHPILKNEAFGTPKQMIDIAIKNGLNGLAITDHDSIKGSIKGLEYSKKIKDFLFVTGVEVSSSEGHILALGIEENVKKNLGVRETIDKIHELGGIAIAAHPYAGWPRTSSLKDNIKKYKFDAIEVLNGGTRVNANRKAYRVAMDLNLPITAGSDSHYFRDLGSIYNIVDCDYSLDSLFKSIRKNELVLKGRPFGFYSNARLVTRKFLRTITSRL